uniref:Uncharacterized protein n=1 Tax=Oryza rufipogon TaxID=4529 RepID=A0A0E0Q8X5_ORYRU
MALRRSSPRSSRLIIHRRSELAVKAKGRLVSKKRSVSGSSVNKMPFKRGDEVLVRTPLGRLGTTALRLVLWLGAVVVSDADADDGHLKVIYNGNFPRDDPFRTVRVAVKDVKLPAPRPAPTPANIAAPRPNKAGKNLPRLKMFVLEKEQLRAKSEAFLASILDQLITAKLIADLNSDTDFNSNSDSAGYKSMRGRLRIHQQFLPPILALPAALSSSMALPRRSSHISSRPIIHCRSELAVEAKGRVVSKKPSGSGSPINKMSSFKKGDEVRVRTSLGRLGTTALRLVMWLGAVVVSDADADDGHLEVIYNGNFPRDDPFQTVRVAVKDVKLPARRPAPTPANMAAPRPNKAGKSLPRLKMFMLEKELLRANPEALLASTDFNSNSVSDLLPSPISTRTPLRLPINPSAPPLTVSAFTTIPSTHPRSSASSSSMALPRRSSPRSSRPIIHRAVDAKGRVVSKKPSAGSPVKKMSSAPSTATPVSFKKGDEVRVRTPVGRLGTTALRLVMWLGAVVVSDSDADDGHLEVIYNGNFPRDDPFRTVRVAVKDVKLPAPRPAPTPANMAAPRPTTAGKNLPRLKMFVLEKEQLRAKSEALFAS